MLEPGAVPCQGCSMVMDNIGHYISHVNARDTTFVFTSPAPQSDITALQKRMGWDTPWYTDRGGELFDTNFRLLDLTPYGRQETWEDSPEGWPQSPPFEWWRMHDEYDT